ncbi:MAG: Peptidyl-prolyl cis-trans isomerase [Candidatus Woesebacteria bacterium GW2011_GWB1_43_14]|uniref:Peptidyl-prolyl cis-trans isomerase n=1 Tax=Candidatus Woesebacteria bacterium GW2011_GWB1_43_14 TaxID=1618578 RepID=A0A0G1GE15_9BACT|nr:MAG: Peptidyl-prolyl cis-trans isomerase [Candidatus Woesebacteria bacterium GW2011_GWA1_39_11b]KKS77596.1 MAG: cyclophilin-type peptidylprolyl cis-trans isomerase, peptidylprolyl isomerase [Candidatus Woesebacteria bacterium GW2011_GWC1_42_9]KKS97093.1 MAG: Peptidyl-prolyl cis-trans isomerase [Candidatus Woesebacteria bacterium GW2011_GWB1_43_14]
MKKFSLPAVGILLVVLLFVISRSQKTVDSVQVEGTMVKSEKVESKVNKPELTVDQTKSYTAVFDTSEGKITVLLFVDKTPITVNNFVYLAQNNFYNNTIFHRAIKGFMIQGGDPLGTGQGGPGYAFDDEPFDGEYARGTVAMANAGPNTNGSQFFIMHQDYDLPKNYVIFGEVTEGMEVVDKIAEAEVSLSASGELSKPASPIKVDSIQIVVK